MTAWGFDRDGPEEGSEVISLVVVWQQRLGVFSYHAVVGTTLATKVQRLVIQDTIVDNTIREHGLRCDAKDKDTEGQVVLGLGVTPHVYIVSNYVSHMKVQ